MSTRNVKKRPIPQQAGRSGLSSGSNKKSKNDEGM